ncbi:MAG: UDP-N-acetylmuramoyl-L-alanine--D-glutamate ligase [Anaplasma sp.]
MILLPRYLGKRVAVFGLGKTGLSVVQSLVQSGARVFVWDDNAEVLQYCRELGIACEFVHPYDYDWDRISELVLSPGVPCSAYKRHWVVRLAAKVGCTITSDVEMFCRSRKARFVGITGTNGKSTTTELIGWIFRNAHIDAETGGNVGKCVLSLPSDREVYILELSSYQIGLLRNVELEIGVILNTTPDHLDVYGNMRDYVAAKGKILNFSGLSVVNHDDPVVSGLARCVKQKIEFSCKRHLSNGVSLLDGCIHHGSEVLHIGDLKIDKTSNLENIAAAYAVARNFGISGEVIIESIREFPGLRHRNQVVAKIANVTFVNDSKATNAAAVEKALAGRRDINWIVGGRTKDGGIDWLLRLYATHIRKAFLVGESSDEFAVSMQTAGVEYVKCHTLERAVHVAFDHAISARGTVVTILLSPACSSLDQWKNFEERGEAFCGLVEELATMHRSRAAMFV